MHSTDLVSQNTPPVVLLSAVDKLYGMAYVRYEPLGLHLASSKPFAKLAKTTFAVTLTGRQSFEAPLHTLASSTP